MNMEVAVAKPLFNDNKEYYIVLNDEYYIKISKSQYYRLRKYINEQHKKEYKFMFKAVKENVDKK